MAKVFTITSGLENMGAMKTGGQGSVYKGRRIGEIITAIKLLPTPIYSESEDDKNYRDFKNEVEKLKKVNQEPNPNVVKILSSGLSETGNFPFIEMEYIEGPDLEELLKPPYDPVFTIKEILKVAEHLSCALAHCHKQGVRHGDIKSNNVKYNYHTGNYILLDFGLAIMSDEQRRSSLRHAGAVEFMAPEQNEGQMLFETDVYSFGVILFELIAGTVPFPLQDKGETARNLVRLSHIETAPPDVLALRKENMPENWAQDKKTREMFLPEWLVKMMYRCLNKKPEERFKSGVELHDYIQHNIAHAPAVAGAAPEKLVREKEHLQKQLVQSQQLLSVKEKELNELKRQISLGKGSTNATQTVDYSTTQKSGVSKGTFMALLFVTIALAAFSTYSYLQSGKSSGSEIAAHTSTSEDSTNADGTPQVDTFSSNLPQQEEKIEKPVKPADTTKKPSTEGARPNEEKPKTTEEVESENTQSEPQPPVIEKPVKQPAQYMVVSKAYFHTEPDESTRRAAYIIPSNNTIVTAIDEKDGFIYIIFDNQVTKTSGWIRKSDLQALSD